MWSRGPASLSDTVQGGGLGGVAQRRASCAYNVVRSSGVAMAVGAVSADDQPVRSVFTGVGEPQEAIEGSGLPAENDSPRGTVLVADDDEAVRTTVTDILGLAHYNVLQAANGDDALQVLSQQPVDVVILDMTMPVIDGMSVLEALGPPPPKVIVLSAFAYNTPEDIDRRGLGRKVTRALRKPCQPAELLAAVNDAIDKLRDED